MIQIYVAFNHLFLKVSNASRLNQMNTEWSRVVDSVCYFLFRIAVMRSCLLNQTILTSKSENQRIIALTGPTQSSSIIQQIVI